MNWLAHALLSEPDVEARLGNLLADIVKGKDRLGLSPAFLRGIRLHQRIDSFTDNHPVVQRSCERIDASYRRVAGILVDIFYDHFLSLDWPTHWDTPLPQFLANLYRDLDAYSDKLPASVVDVTRRMMSQDWLGSYGTFPGMQSVLKRLAARLRMRTGSDFRLREATSELERNYDALRGDFAEFFPQLKAAVPQMLAGPQR